MSLPLYKNRFKNHLSLDVLAIFLSFRKTDIPERCIFVIIILETRKVKLRLQPHKAHNAIHPHELGTTQFSRKLYLYNPLTPSVTHPRTRPSFLLYPCPHPHRL